ncbi:MAG: hypothetical protein KAY24_03945 [Candidatus Eisenbacteria sp.]|nr:hypothetical protein [Candidatus Eisenbacteria bacterium]
MRSARTALLNVSIAILSVSLTWTQSGADPIQWSISQGGNAHYYEGVVVPGDCTREEANQLATSSTWMGAHGYLATSTSAEENEFVWNELGDVGTYWLGGYQPPGSPEPDGGWTWVTGEPWVHTNWHQGEPNNSGGNECYLHFHMSVSNGSWNDYNPEGTAAGYVVEFEPTITSADQSTWGAIKDLFAH